MFPENLVRSVETVTGGASAAYGTDAVAGVVNFVLDTDYEGFKLSYQQGENFHGHNGNSEYNLGAGFKIGEKVHVLLNYEAGEQDPIWGNDILDYDWYKGTALLGTGGGTSRSDPLLEEYDYVYSNRYSLDGMIHYPAGSAVSTPYILDENGTATPFVPGDTCTGQACSYATTGSLTRQEALEQGVVYTQMTPETSRDNAFVYVDYEVTDDFSIYGQLMSGESEWTNINFGGLFPRPFTGPPIAARSFTINSGNPYIPANVQAEMTANGINQLYLSRIGAPDDVGFDAFTTQTTEIDSYTVGFEYDFLASWQLRGYYQTGETNFVADQRGGIRLDRIYLAADVVGTVANPQCNVTATSGLYPDCVPINMFGAGGGSNPTAAGYDWVTNFEAGVAIDAQGFLTATETINHSYTSGETKKRVVNIQQDVWEISADGEISDGWGAGAITMAAGFGAREESFVQVVEVGPGGNIDANPAARPVAADNPGQGIRGVPTGAAASGNSVEIQFSNVPFARGEQDVTEVFTEFLVPLVSGVAGFEQVNFNAAARWADYSGAGAQWSWKSGFDWTVNDDVRFRATVSQDVRAATMGEKFDRTGGIAGNLTDYSVNPPPAAYNATQFSNGSPDIQPEKARTYTLGMVYQPSWADGLNLSLDWFSIDIQDNITGLAAQSVVTGCHVDGDQDLCALITRDPADVLTGNPDGRITLIGIPYVNQDSVSSRGVDVEIAYRTDVDWFGGGETAGVRFLGSYLGERVNKNAGSETNIAGRFGTPRWSQILSGNYRRGELMVSMSARYTKATKANAAQNLGTTWDVANNEVDAEFLIDARVGYDFDVSGYNLNVYANINNLLDEDPQEFFGGGEYSSIFSTGPGLGHTGDLRGRRYVIGAQLEF
jgi:outer membrane receptor protein involved in Fe transport